MHWSRHPVVGKLAGTLSSEEIDSKVQELESRIAAKALEDGVLVAKGSLFSWNNNAGGQLHLRMTFVAAAKGELDDGVSLFAHVLKGEF